MHSIGMIVRIIGMVLLVLVCLLLILLLAFLLVPIRYEVSFHRLPGKTEGWESGGKARASWLLGAVSFTVHVRETAWEGRLQVLWFTLKRLGSGSDATKPFAREQEGAADTELEEASEETAESRTAGPSKEAAESRTAGPSERAAESRTAGSSKKAARPEKRRQRGMGALAERALWLCLDLPGKAAQLIQEMFAALWEGGDRLDSFRDDLEKRKRKIQPFLPEAAGDWYRKAGKKLLTCLRHFRPRQVRGRLEIGTGSPDTTALAVGAIFRILGSGARDLEIIPDFYERNLQADCRLKGHIRLNHLAWMGLTLLLDGQTRQMIRRIRKSQGGR